MAGCKATSTPMSADDLKDDPLVNPKLEEALEPHAAKRFRRCAAIVVYAGQDRPDLSASACHLARKMSAPNLRDEEKPRRTARYLRGRPRG